MPAPVAGPRAGNQLHRLAGAWRQRTGGRWPTPRQPPLVWPPPLSYQQMRRLAGRPPPGACYRRYVYRRYSLVWTKPAVIPGPAPPR